MITLDLKVTGKLGNLKIKDDVLFNAILCKNPTLIRKLIKSIHPLYKISKTFFAIVNNYVDFSKEGMSMYCGLIVRTGYANYAVLLLEGSEIDEEYLVTLVNEYIHDSGYTPKEVNINKFEISKKDFLHATRKL